MPGVWDLHGELWLPWTTVAYLRSDRKLGKGTPPILGHFSATSFFSVSLLRAWMVIPQGKEVAHKGWLPD